MPDSQNAIDVLTGIEASLNAVSVGLTKRISDVSLQDGEDALAKLKAEIADVRAEHAAVQVLHATAITALDVSSTALTQERNAARTDFLAKEATYLPLYAPVSVLERELADMVAEEAAHPALNTAAIAEEARLTAVTGRRSRTPGHAQALADAQANVRILAALAVSRPLAIVAKRDAIATAKNPAFMQAKQEHDDAKAVLDKFQDQVDDCDAAKRKANAAVNARIATQEARLKPIEGQVTRIRKDPNFEEFERLRAEHVASMQPPTTAEDHAAVARRRSAAFRGQPDDADMHAAELYGQASGAGDPHAHQLAQHAQSEREDVSRTISGTEHKLASFMNAQDDLLDNDEMRQQAADEARERRLRDIMDAINLDAYSSAEELAKKAVAWGNSYFTNDKKTFEQIKTCIFGAGQKQHVSVDLQSAPLLSALRILVAVFLLLFMVVRKVLFAVPNLAAKKFQKAAIRGLVEVEVTRNDGKFDLDKFKTLLQDASERTGLPLEDKGKVRADVDSQMDDHLLEAAKVAYTMGVPIEDIKGWEHLKHVDKFKAFVDFEYRQTGYTRTVECYREKRRKYDSKQKVEEDSAKQDRSVASAPGKHKTGGNTPDKQKSGNGMGDMMKQMGNMGRAH